MSEIHTTVKPLNPHDDGATQAREASTVVEERDAAGRLVSRTTFAGGVPHGPMLRYQQDGSPHVEAGFAHGLLSGPFRIFDAQGTLLQESHYEAGKLHGVVSRYQDGRLASQQHYAGGVLHGPSLCVCPAGLVSARLHYEAGQLTREAVFLHDGAVVRRAPYAHGRLDGEAGDYARDGKLMQSTPYRANLLHGTVRRYAQDGSVQESRRYDMGKPQEAWQAADAPREAASHEAADKASAPMLRQFEKWVRG
ncbi:toxin-antitoxin system YwqK family antitoxin [Paraburkholderia unamae]|uniref:Antitoxin component YwqK of YwqJK toxin-antitoxin module n=1 Tax=Paraburkholderia unamae TaxID=219649 RepID=A0ABX5KR89_9BURK|nr:toxin-antitoxin system YwqK family antitoxin [Paraburkholderia unamae]PVX85176.1 hypothetical protein C7402_104420 [Paraburkholderia unamae]